MAEQTTLTLPEIEIFKSKALQWANYFNVVCLFDNNAYTDSKYHSKEWVLAVDAVDEITCGDDAFNHLKQFQANAGTTIFGMLAYDLKNQIEKLHSRHYDGIRFPQLYFFKPRYVIEISGNKVTINRNYPETFELIELIGKIKPDNQQPATNNSIQLNRRTTKNQYLQNVEAIKKQIEEGTFYELNYCNEFYAEDIAINPLQVFEKLNARGKAPFSSFFKLHDKYLLCASPERFLKKEGHQLISQPIKGTIRKGADATETEALKQQLYNDVKERAENVMIVDLVRNDLAHTSVAGSVKVKELFGIYEFNTVIQMISTITAQIRDDVHFTEAIKNAFPMGSMTGAPKVMVMQQIENYEATKRGLYSGSVGYITPNGDFDLNVVIRSIQYNAASQYVSIQVGGAITYDSVAEKEYDEMMLKAQNMMQVLGATVTDE